MDVNADTSSARARSILDDLIRQRQLMQGSAADASLIEANRLGIVYWQWQLSRALSAERAQAGTAAAAWTSGRAWTARSGICVSTGSKRVKAPKRSKARCLTSGWATLVGLVMNKKSSNYIKKTGCRSLYDSGSLISYAATLSSCPIIEKVSPSGSRSTMITSPSLNSPDRILSANGSCSSRWMVRLSGRAPKLGS